MYKMDDTEASLIIDDFLKNRSVQITKVAGSVDNLFVRTFELDSSFVSLENLKSIGLQFAFKNGIFYLRLKGNVVPNDILQFLFEDGTIIDKKIENSVFLHRKENAINVELSNSEMKKFANSFLSKWKYTSNLLNTFYVGGFIDNSYFEQYSNSIDGQYLLLATARQLVKQILFHLPEYGVKRILD